jgi:hypothetical protein
VTVIDWPSETAGGVSGVWAGALTATGCSGGGAASTGCPLAQTSAAALNTTPNWPSCTNPRKWLAIEALVAKRYAASRTFRAVKFTP